MPKTLFLVGFVNRINIHVYICIYSFIKLYTCIHMHIIYTYIDCLEAFIIRTCKKEGFGLTRAGRGKQHAAEGFLDSLVIHGFRSFKAVRWGHRLACVCMSAV